MQKTHDSILPCEAHFSPFEQALFDELAAEAEVDAIVDALFPDDVP